MFVHSHPPNLRGTKFFQWGKDLSGQFMQDFMSASNYESDKCTAPYYDPWCEEYDHEGDYTELQVGPADASAAANDEIVMVRANKKAPANIPSISVT